VPIPRKIISLAPGRCVNVKRSLQDEPRKGDEKKKDVKLVELNVSEMNAFVIPEKTTLYAGERFNSQVVMAAIDSTQRPEIYVNGSRLQAADGRYSFTAGGVGEHQFNGYILMKGKEGEEIRRNFSQKYTVLPVPNSATVAADLMNVLYAGYANPISISVPGVPANAISASMSGGSFVSKGNGHFVATPSTVGKDVTIHVMARDKGQVTVPIVGLSFDAAALYDQKEADVKYVGTNGDFGQANVKQQSINIPVNVRYGFGLSSLANIFLFAGPQWGINVGDKNFTWNETSSYSLKKSNFSVNVGAGVTLLNHLQISANYNIACGKSADASFSKALDAVTNAGKDKSRNNSWQIALGYWF
jgi:hypothetical protein